MSDETIAERVEADRALYAAAYAEGHAAGLAEGLAQGASHPAVVESVARVFAGWDGADAAHDRSVARFCDWYDQARAERTEVAEHECAA